MKSTKPTEVVHLETLMEELKFTVAIKDLKKSLETLLFEWFLSDQSFPKEERHTMISHYTALIDFLNGAEEKKEEK